MKSKLFFFVMLLLALLPILILRDYTPSNELRYLSIADEALRNGDVFTFTNHGLPYADKPPLYFWVVMFGKWLLGSHAMWFISLFSLIPAFITVFVMDKWVSGVASRSDRYTAMLMLMSSGLFLGLAVVLRMDMLMCMFITLALYTFYRMYSNEGNKTKNSLLFPFYVFMAVFSKGPVGLLVPLVSVVTFLMVSGKIKTLGKYWGWRTFAVLLAGCAIWFGGVIWEEGGLDYLHNLLFRQTVGRAVNAFDHDAPFYYYFISVWYSLAPWSLLIIWVIKSGVYKRQILTDMERLFMVVIVTTFVMLSCFSGKLAVYLAPAFPFFVYLTILLLSRFGWDRWIALSVAIPSVIFAVAVPAVIALGTMKDTLFLDNTFFYIASGVLTISGIMALVLLYKYKIINKAVNTLAIGLFCALFVGGWAVPSMNSDMGYAQLCNKAMEISKENGLSGYCVLNISRPENMDVYLHEDVNIVETQDILNNKYQGTILMVSNKKINSDSDLQKYLSGRDRYIVGRFSIFVL